MNILLDNLYRTFINSRNNICVAIDKEQHTYGEVFDISCQIRHQIQKTSSQNIGIYLTDDVFMYASILAIWLEGKTYVPIHPEFPYNKNKNVIEQAETETILSSVEIKEDFGVNTINSNEDFGRVCVPPKNIPMETNAYILFTSGSTGNPKGVPIQFSNLFYFSESFHTTFGNLNTDDSVLQMFELTFDLSVMSYLIPWLNGAKITALHKNETKYLQILDLLEANEITVALMVPSILNLIIPYLDSEINNESLRLNLFCGEALLAKQIENWKGFVPNSEMYNVYGPTENTIFCTFYKIGNHIKEKNGIISIGKSLPNSCMRFLDDSLNEGELLLSGKLLTQFYWKNEIKTQETFIEIQGEKLYRTGDWCIKDDEGDFYYTNRIDFQAKINGFRVELAEIEYFANQKLENAVSVTVLHKDNSGNDVLILFVNDLSASEDTIYQHLKKNLPDYCIPQKIIKLEKFPVNTSGKTDRNELKNLI
ncbi:hypothetical protein ASG31_14810 [Chryseobacterium sp. Leaf404]|uniref:AMP-binding protein n=1 Tax=unclassified Chryseobacterium TaxID=2593645 RepID=UPI0006FBE86F|nr:MULTISPECIES: AMP-binding protein [unclassified Chryseobacterium]KQT15528.1 hypothetical protein ASG31_14810 [Chryseobacterium sp. Leaf404]